MGSEPGGEGCAFIDFSEAAGQGLADTPKEAGGLHTACCVAVAGFFMWPDSGCTKL